MKKIFLILTLMLNLCAFSAQKLYVEALEDFNSQNPSETFKVKLIENVSFDKFELSSGDKLNCSFQNKKDAKRAKIDAKIFFKVESYENNKGFHEIEENLIAKYAKNVLNKETVKRNVTLKKATKTAAKVVGGAFVEGASYIVSFADGMITNPENNRLKSGAKQIYDDSFLSYVEYGDEIDIKTGDKFYFVIKTKDEKEKE